jgi:hypothetical protein
MKEEQSFAAVLFLYTQAHKEDSCHTAGVPCVVADYLHPGM